MSRSKTGKIDSRKTWQVAEGQEPRAEKGFLARRDRRWFLQMAGGSVALAYWLERGIRRAEGASPPKRFMIIHRPNGGVPENWIRNGEPGPILEPFMPVWSHAVALKGLSIKPGKNGNGDPHGRSLTTIMTGADMSPKIPPGSDDGRWNTVESIDQTWSRESPVLNVAPVKSVQAGGNGRMSGRQEPQNRTLSYSGAEQPLYPVISPNDVYKRLFGGTIAPGGDTPANMEALSKLRRRRESVLRFVQSDLGRVRQQFPASARPELEAHADAIRELEARLDGSGAAPTARCQPPSMPPQGLAIGSTNHNEIAKVADAHFTILRAAFACDLTRMVTFMWATGASAMSFSTFGSGDHHKTSHSANKGALSAIDRWFSEKTAPFIRSLIETPDPAGGKLIDNTFIWYINENAAGYGHTLTDMPFLLFGGDGVGLTNRGRIAAVEGTTSNDVWLSVANVFGMSSVKSFPTAHTGPIPGLIAG